MEPLTVAGSVAGMVTAASKMVPLLYSLGSAIKDDSPKLAQIAAIELETITATLQQLQQLIGIASIEKRSLITVSLFFSSQLQRIQHLDSIRPQ